MQKTKIVYSLRIFLTLQRMGFYPISTTMNPQNNKLMCWIFARTPEFEEALTAAIEGRECKDGG